MSSLLVPQITVLRGPVPEPFCSVMAKIPTGETVVYLPNMMKTIVKEIKTRKGFIDMGARRFQHSMMFYISIDPNLPEEEVYAFQSSLAEILLEAMVDNTVEVEIQREKVQS